MAVVARVALDPGVEGTVAVDLERRGSGMKRNISTTGPMKAGAHLGHEEQGIAEESETGRGFGASDFGHSPSMLHSRLPIYC